uniref:Uncharacterized protein n=1 Tax=Ananas comosus var. bracteatus TaxID=296719 RepID=A0A6V7QL89_ANACO|nr:unnamed protein product [Ananas comosus var. bracteatus]
MDRENDSSTRCRKHPTEIFTGFCPSCLVERLSTVGTSNSRSEIVEEISTEISVVSSVAEEKKPTEIRCKKTLLSLFQLDDVVDNGVNEESLRKEVESSRIGNNGASCSEAATSGNVAADEKIMVALDERKLDGKGVLYWLSSILPRKGLTRGKVNTSNDGRSQERCSIDRPRETPLERKPSFRYSCDWMVCREPRRGSWELPRHSWDGSVVSRALACSFACLEERKDGIRTLADESSADLAISRINRRKSHRWSNVWDWSVTSPLRDIVKKRERVLERSLSESWKDGRKDKIIEATEADSGVHVNGNGSSSSRESQSVKRNVNAANDDMQNLKPDWQTKRESRLGRSRSVHYSSPGNVDNGLLRFYLTPLRSSRSTNKSRRKNSRLFARGIFGTSSFTLSNVSDLGPAEDRSEELIDALPADFKGIIWLFQLLRSKPDLTLQIQPSIDVSFEDFQQQQHIPIDRAEIGQGKAPARTFGRSKTTWQYPVSDPNTHLVCSNHIFGLVQGRLRVRLFNELRNQYSRLSVRKVERPEKVRTSAGPFGRVFGRPKADLSQANS